MFWGGSNEYPQFMFLAEIWKLSEFFIWKFSFFGGKNSVYLNRLVFVFFFPGQAYSSKQLTSACAHTFASNWQLSFFNQQNCENFRRNDFMIPLNESIVSELEFELATSELKSDVLPTAL